MRVRSVFLCGRCPGLSEQEICSILLWGKMSRFKRTRDNICYNVPIAGSNSSHCIEGHRVEAVWAISIHDKDSVDVLTCLLVNIDGRPSMQCEPKVIRGGEVCSSGR
uniref:Uncharacterized protein n=1 Tax=Cacopsylla melanoneura TaxID=428564 RepID=A0A8D8U7E2_9HEMI